MPSGASCVIWALICSKSSATFSCRTLLKEGHSIMTWRNLRMDIYIIYIHTGVQFQWVNQSNLSTSPKSPLQKCIWDDQCSHEFQNTCCWPWVMATQSTCWTPQEPVKEDAPLRNVSKNGLTSQQGLAIRKHLFNAKTSDNPFGSVQCWTNCPSTPHVLPKERLCGQHLSTHVKQFPIGRTDFPDESV